MLALSLFRKIVVFEKPYSSSTLCLHQSKYWVFCRPPPSRGLDCSGLCDMWLLCLPLPLPLLLLALVLLVLVLLLLLLWLLLLLLLLLLVVVCGSSGSFVPVLAVLAVDVVELGILYLLCIQAKTSLSHSPEQSIPPPPKRFTISCRLL